MSKEQFPQPGLPKEGNEVVQDDLLAKEESTDQRLSMPLSGMRVELPEQISVRGGEIVDESEIPTRSFEMAIANPEDWRQMALEMKPREWALLHDFDQIYKEVEASSYRHIHSIVAQKYHGSEMDNLRTFLIASAKSIEQLKDVLYGISLKGASREKPYRWEELVFLLNASTENPGNLNAIPRAMNLRQKAKELLRAEGFLK